MTLFFFALGAVVASFLGVVVARLNTGQGFLSGRSCCDACGATLRASHLVPVASYIWHGGRAGCCRTRLSLLSPLSEITLGGLYAGMYIVLGFQMALAFFLLSLGLLAALVLYDLAHQILPWPLLLPFIAASAAARLALSPHGEWAYAFLSAFAAAAVLALIHVISRGRAMGLADAPLAFALALLVGPGLVLAGFVFSFWIGAGIGIILLFMRPAGSRMGVEVPFAPFLAAGFLLAFFTQWNPFAYLAASLW
ncbi:prepilin peptidase [Candidatus Kaiserbacteria bacterium]|nr:prepilin peptidase [Candidatus Kaiserbacteria bacterium]